MEKKHFIQNCLQDNYVAEENDLSLGRAKMFYEANDPLLNNDQKSVFDYIRNLIVTQNRDGLLMFLMILEVQERLLL